MKHSLLFACLILFVSLRLSVPALAQSSDAPTETVSPTIDPQPTDAAEPTETATPTSEPSPTATATATLVPTEPVSPTATAVPDCADAHEPNDAPGSGPVLLADQPLTGLSLAPADDVDAFQIWVKTGRYYQLDTATLDGVDTRLRLWDAAGALLAENDDSPVGPPASRLAFQAPADGWLFVTVDSLVPIEWGCRRYNLALTGISGPTPTPTASPEPTRTAAPPPPSTTPLPALFDPYEPNYDLTTAANIGVNQMLDLNFHLFPPGDPGIDNDFFRLYVKSGQDLQIETLELAPGVDTNLILYREDGSTVIGGNDDCAPGQQRSCLTWAPDYTGLAYLLVGPVGLTPQAISAEALSYRLSVTDRAGQPTTTPLPVLGESMPLGSPMPWPHDPPPVATATPVPTTIPTITVETYSLAPPSPTPLPLQPIAVQLTLYYDENDNRAPDLNEGVTGVTLQLLDSRSNQVLGQGVTNRAGHASLFVSATQEVRLAVPYLGYSQPVRPPGGAFEIRIPAIHLPSLIP